MKRVLFSAAIAALALTSCKKDKGGDEQKAITKENIIGTYKLTSYKIADQDMMQQFDACQRDDQYAFKASDVFEVTDAGTQCDPVGSGSSTWSLNGDVISLEAMEETGKVTALTSSILEITDTQTQQGFTFTTKIVFTRQ